MDLMNTTLAKHIPVFLVIRTFLKAQSLRLHMNGLILMFSDNILTQHLNFKAWKLSIQIAISWILPLLIIVNISQSCLYGCCQVLESCNFECFYASVVQSSFMGASQGQVSANVLGLLHITLQKCSGPEWGQIQERSIQGVWPAGQRQQIIINAVISRQTTKMIP